MTARLHALPESYYESAFESIENPIASVVVQVDPPVLPPLSLRASGLSWSIEHIGYAPNDQSKPIMKVSLTVGPPVNKTLPVGTYGLSCTKQEKTQDPNELTAVVCWWGGGGYEVGVFKEGNTYVVKQGNVDEGTAEIDGFRGNFKTLFEIK